MYLKNVKLAYNEHNDIYYAQECVVVWKEIPRAGDMNGNDLIEKVEKTNVCIQETRRNDYDFYNLFIFDKLNYENDLKQYQTINIKNYRREELIAIEKEQ